MKTAVIYARYSSERQTEQSIEGQVRVCKDYAERNDIVIVDTYIDRAMTGTNDNRRDFQRMIKDSNKKAWDIVLVYKLDRFSRNKYEMATHKKTLRDNGIKLVSAMENIPETPEGIILESLLEGMAEYYSAELSQKVKRGLNESRQKGTFLGGYTPFGYKVENKKLLIHKENASIVKFIFEQYASGVFVKDIKKDLDNRGVLNRGNPLSVNGIYHILKSEKYAGIYTHNGVTYTNMFPRIVSENVYNIVRNKIEENHYGKHTSEAVYLLKNLVKCGYCGKPIASESGTSKNGDIKRYYKCSGRKHGSTCNKSIIRKELLEDLVVNTTIKAFTKEIDLHELARKLLQKLNDQINDQSILNLLENEQSNVQKSLNNMLDAVEKGIITSSTKQRIEELEFKLEDIKSKILIEKSRGKILLNENDIVNYITIALQKDPKQLIKLLIKEIVLFDDRIDIYYKHSNTKKPDDTISHQAFSFYSDCYVCPQEQCLYGNKTVPLSMKIILFL